MPIWLTFIGSLLAAGGLFFAGFMAVEILVGRRQAFGRPKLILDGGKGPGQIGVGVTWNTNFFAVEFYRIEVNLFAPDHAEKESRFTFSYQPPLKEPFYLSFPVTEAFKNVIEGTSDKRALFNISIRTTEEKSIEKDIGLKEMRKLYSGTGGKHSKVKVLEAKEFDPAVSMSLDFEELETRKARIDKLVAAAKAKADKAKAAAPAAAPKPAAAKAPAAETDTATAKG